MHQLVLPWRGRIETSSSSWTSTFTSGVYVVVSSVWKSSNWWLSSIRRRRNVFLSIQVS
jgi:hypothetical protein